MHILGFVFIITTTLVMIMKKEIENTDDIKHVKEEGERKKNKKTMKNYEDNLSIKSTYLLMHLLKNL